MAYPFLILSLLLSVPGLLIYGMRPDLRQMQRRMALLSVPFACTEFFFYPTYWSPPFLWDAAEHIGFGLEDILFVMALGMFVSAAYPALFRRSLIQREGSAPEGRVVRMLLPIGISLSLATGAYMLSVPVIWAVVPIMLAVTAGLCMRRRDLVVPALLGAPCVVGIYFLICLLLQWFLPGVFALNWNAELFSNRFVLGVPLEELTYAYAAGAAGTVFYPFAFDLRFRRLR